MYRMQTGIRLCRPHGLAPSPWQATIALTPWVRGSASECKKNANDGKSCTHTIKRHASSDENPFKTLAFWTHGYAWKRASVNTFRCLVGCSVGDLSALYYLQTHTQLPMHVTMGASMASGILTSVILETLLLQMTDGMNARQAYKTAVGMSLVSMLVMESVENVVSLNIGNTSIASVIVSMMSGYIAALPYNYYQLRKYNKACH
ncbi:uncharacterized protein SPPG_03894 [Spizellomyces punctatus DAOM BR117]|uniref:DUF4396 domain-containing protein n=1 Tax=Spizellomyces punctatus (strain DAOM BR117) TaxID=645134 RepID=A0A0L0HH38_SPIPD|nr:uncharacterized protein SPPG_03894 [Spizellomyces punctatus DAOM BR117]KND00781.1 hypothetical protein SPPG_03894 [Spizellomyces punctatus DAOM BR117]|eukprot:XP_016608820.1 hypothetical protein SPPG_03894 [Spizellomyces punctatus DAOM BR117]